MTQGTQSRIYNNLEVGMGTVKRRLEKGRDISTPMVYMLIYDRNQTNIVQSNHQSIKYIYVLKTYSTQQKQF